MTMRLDTTKLENVKRVSDGIICACPACRDEGGDKGRDNLKIFTSGAYVCIKYGTEDKAHSRFIRAFLRGTALSDNPEEEYIDPEPKLKVDKVYPESTIARLLPDYTYWLGRGAREDVVRKLEGGLAPTDEKSKLSNRFVFPIRGLDGRIHGFTGRLTSYSSYAPSWKHLFRSGQAVYPWNVNGAAIRASGIVILVESVGDLIALMSHDINNVLCIFGLNLNGKVISTLIGAGVQRVIVSLNSDEDASKGQRAAEQIKTKLCAFFNESNVTVRLPTSSKDWGAASSDEIEAFKREVQS